MEEAGGRIGDINISLMWNNYNDLDLHVVCPSGERLHGGNRVSACGGELDVDANVKPETKKPVENVVWDVGKAEDGLYRVYVHHYKKHKKFRTRDPTKFKIITGVKDKFTEFNSQLSHGDPILLVTEFTLGEGSEPTPASEAEEPSEGGKSEVDPLEEFMEENDLENDEKSE